MAPARSLTIVLPAYNEALNVPRLLRVRCTYATDEVVLRMPRGQNPDDYHAAAANLAAATLPKPATPWVAIPRGVRAFCSKAGGASVLEVRALGGGDVDAGWLGHGCWCYPPCRVPRPARC